MADDQKVIRPPKFHWYSFYVKIQTGDKLDEISFFGGFNEKKLTRKDIVNLNVGKKLGKIKDNKCCICNISYLGFMTKKEFND